MFLIILAGIPCSGKTELATILAKELEFSHCLPTVVVDPDKIRGMIPALSEHFDPQRESLVNSIALDIIEKSLRKKNIVISDDMNYYESARHRLVQIAKKHRIKYIIVYLTVSVETAKGRNAARASSIPEGIISEIAKSFDYPGAKYKWDRPSLVIDSEKASPEDAAKRVLQVVLSEIKEGSAKSTDPIGRSMEMRDQKTTTLSHFKQALDESTRAILNESFSSGKLDPELSRSASKMRKAFVNEAYRSSMTINDANSKFRKRVQELSIKGKH
jgi:tRNA uridine 5-carbamoylmethylation protein Kti12